MNEDMQKDSENLAEQEQNTRGQTSEIKAERKEDTRSQYREDDDQP